MLWIRKDERRDRECEELRVEERKKRNIKKEIKLEKSVGVREMEQEKGSRSGGEEREGREGEMAAHQS